MTILGDAIAPRGGVIALGSLIELARPFGITDRHVRTAIGRLANEQWVSSQRSGRVSFYRLTNHGRARFAEATQRIYGAPPAEWNGEWTLVIFPRSSRAARDELREELTLARLRPADERRVRTSDASRRHRARARRGARICGRGHRDSARRRHARVERATGRDGLGSGRAGATLSTLHRNVRAARRRADSLSASGRRNSVRAAHAARARISQDSPARSAAARFAAAASSGPAPTRTRCAATCTRKCSPLRRNFCRQRVQTLDGALPPPAAEVFARFGGLPQALVRQFSSRATSTCRNRFARCPSITRWSSVSVT